MGPKHSSTTEIRCKGAVVRVEQRHALETPIALAVAIRDYRIVRRDVFREDPMGMLEHRSRGESRSGTALMTIGCGMSATGKIPSVVSGRHGMARALPHFAPRRPYAFGVG